jgi:hypothetical protein
MLKVTQRGSVQCVRELSSQEDHALRWAFGHFAAPEARADGATVVARYQKPARAVGSSVIALAG